MNLIINNPFRILGLDIKASERDIAKRITDLKIYAAMGKSKHYDTDFSFLPSFQRTAETIREASNRIEQPDSRLLYAMFWFWRNNSTDELVFDLLKDSKYEKAIGILEKAIGQENTSRKIYSNTKNLFTLYLALATNGSINSDYLSKGLYFASEFFSYGFLAEFAQTILGDKAVIDTEKTLRSFIDEVLQSVKPYLERDNGNDAQTYLKAFNFFPDEIYKYSIANFISDPLYNINTDISKTVKKRTNDPQNAHQYGEELFDNTIDDLEHLNTLLPNSDLQYQMIADKLANEILQCSIDFFNKCRDDDNFDPGEDALKIAESASSIVAGDRVRNRIEETVSVYNEWLDDKPKRERLKKVQPYIDHITDRLENLPDQDFLTKSRTAGLTGTAQKLIDQCSHSLRAIKNILGRHDDLYLDISTSVASNAMGMCIECVNENHKYDEALTVMKRIGDLDMAPKLLGDYKKNLGILESNYKLWEAEKAEEDLHRKIKHHIDFLKIQIESLPDPELTSIGEANRLPEIAHRLIDNCKTRLIALKKALGSQDEFYLRISSAVVNNALGMCIAYSNRTHEYSRSLSVIEAIGDLDMEPEVHVRYLKNKEILNKNKALALVNQMIQASAPPKKSSAGCYIATMVYGNYDSPEVLKLRMFRDNCLARYYAGRYFIRIYYGYSPFFVNKFKHSRAINKIIRSFLEQLTKALKI